MMKVEFHWLTDELAQAYMEVEPAVAESKIQEAIETLKQP
jgi:hypothetical protein